MWFCKLILKIKIMAFLSQAGHELFENNATADNFAMRNSPLKAMALRKYGLQCFPSASSVSNSSQNKKSKQTEFIENS